MSVENTSRKLVFLTDRDRTVKLIDAVKIDQVRLQNGNKILGNLVTDLLTALAKAYQGSKGNCRVSLASAGGKAAVGGRQISDT